MCGVVGFVGFSDADAAHRLRAMCDAIVHRGPDGDGRWLEPGIALGMRRLSIIDLEGGWQPVWNEDRSVVVVFNGEIYNYRELGADLRRRHTFGSDSDTEVLVHLYEERGDALVHELRGMFAFALWDLRRRRLLIARDRLGIKPLYYRVHGAGLAFGSELKALEAGGFADGTPDRAAIARFLAFGYIPDPFSIYPDVRKLLPGHLLHWEPDTGVRTERYWSPPAEADPRIDEVAAIEETRRLLAEAVRYRLVADVPVGAFLSGGVDSAAVVAEMARQMDRPVETYTIGFPVAAYNEAPAAAETARALGTRHHELMVRPDAETLIETVVAAFDEPFGDSSALPTFLVSRLAAADLKVVLSGDGGDELFGGYTRYRDYAHRNVALPAGVRRALYALATRLPRSAHGRNRLLEFSRDPVARYAGMVSHPLIPAEGGVANDLTAGSAHWPTLLASAFAEATARDSLGRLMHVDLLTYLPGDILTKLDRMSMAVSLEARVPLLDHKLVEFACRIPTALKIRGDSGKYILREAVRPGLPASLFERPKRGFGLPLAQWLRNEFRHRVADLAAPGSTLSDYVEPRAVEALRAEHMTGRRDHSAMLWKLLVLQQWFVRQAVGARTPASKFCLT